MVSTILVTGASGHCGQATIKALAALRNKGVPIRILGLLRDNKRIQEVFNLGADDVRIANLEDSASLEAAFAGVTSVLIVPPSTENRGDLAIAAINAAEKARVPRVVLLSVLGSDNQAITFHRQFYPIERELAYSLADWTILRLPFFLDNFWGWADGIKRGGLYMALGSGSLPLVAVSDIGEACATVLTQDNHSEKVYSLVGDVIRGDSAAATFAAATSHDVKYVAVPGEAAKGALLGMGIPDWQADGIVELFAYHEREVDAPKHEGELLALLGRKPYTLADFARDNAASFTSSRAAPDTSADSTVSASRIDSNSSVSQSFNSSTAPQSLHDSRFMAGPLLDSSGVAPLTVSYALVPSSLNNSVSSSSSYSDASSSFSLSSYGSSPASGLVVGSLGGGRPLYPYGSGAVYPTNQVVPYGGTMGSMTLASYGAPQQVSPYMYPSVSPLAMTPHPSFMPMYDPGMMAPYGVSGGFATHRRRRHHHHHHHSHSSSSTASASSSAPVHAPVSVASPAPTSTPAAAPQSVVQASPPHELYRDSFYDSFYASFYDLNHVPGTPLDGARSRHSSSRSRR